MVNGYMQKLVPNKHKTQILFNCKEHLTKTGHMLVHKEKSQVLKSKSYRPDSQTTVQPS